MDVPDVCYARSGDVAIAYQVIGDGPEDLVLLPFLSNIWSLWLLPAFAQFTRRLAHGRRLILVNPRGVGLSDRPRSFTVESRMDDVRAVLDAVGSERPALLGIGESAATPFRVELLTPEEAADLFEALLWRSDEEFANPGWHTHITDSEGRELTIAISGDAIIANRFHKPSQDCGIPTDDDETKSLQRVYATSLGPVEMGLNPDASYVFISLFDADGLIASRSSDEWENADVANLLHVEIGLPEAESQLLAQKFIASASSEGHDQPPIKKVPLLGVLALVGFVVGLVALMGIGFWTIVSWIF